MEDLDSVSLPHPFHFHMFPHDRAAPGLGGSSRDGTGQEFLQCIWEQGLQVA
jgi:hypothetical protein